MSTLVALAVIFLLTVANGLFAMSETAVVSARRARLQERAERGDAAAARALRLAESPNVFLATVQIGITLIGIVLGAFGGARFSGPLADLLERVPIVERIADTAAFVAVVVLITYASLVIGELVPKRIALNNPERVAAVVAGPMTALSRVVAPFVRLLGASTNAVLGLLRVGDSDDPPVTEEELGVLLEQGALAGIFRPEERLMTERVFDLADDRVTALMTPRTDVIWIDVDASPEEIKETILLFPHGRYPVGRGSLDNLVGVVNLRELLLRSPEAPWSLPESFQPPLVLPESTMALRALDRFRQTGEHLAIIVDEYGGIAGILSITDILEALVGDLSTPVEGGDRETFQRPDGSWLIDGGLPADELAKLLDIRPLPGEGEGVYETTAGFVLAQLGHIPGIGEQFVLGDWSFEVIDMDGHRIDKVLATSIARENEDD